MFKLNRISTFASSAALLFGLTGCFGHHSPHTTHNPDDDMHCHDSSECAAVGVALLAVGLVAIAATDSGKASPHASRDATYVPKSSVRASAARYSDSNACLYNPQCLPPSHPTCREAPDGCCAC